MNEPAPEVFEKAIELIDAANARDPNREADEKGEPQPKELLYSRRMTRWLERLEPEASPALRLAARAQHVERWRVPRSEFPEGRAGYLKWRTHLYRVHADRARELMAEAGVDEATRERAAELIAKKNLRTDAEAQTLEDVACLVFLEHYFGDFAPKYDEAKVIGILRKTWRKMSPRGHDAARELAAGTPAEALLGKALEGKEE